MTSDSGGVIIVGSGSIIDTCAAVLAARGAKVRTLQCERVDGAGFDLQPLVDYPAHEWQAFAAVGNDLLNLMRLGLMAELRGAGYHIARVISQRACVPDDWGTGENVFVDDGAVIGTGASVRHNVFIGAGAKVGAGAKLGHSIWIGPGAILGPGCMVGDGTIISAGAIVHEGVSVGRQCDLGIAREFRADVPDRTFFAEGFDGSVRIHSPIPHGVNNAAG
jgi:UDP-3-O-[3-hydroxymyristoyl] glucosamine N-acyltransferase